MRFDIRKLKNPSQSDNLLRGKNKWNLKKYKVRKSKFPNSGVLEGKDIDKKIIDIFGEEMIKAIVEEAKIATAKGARLPKSKQFYDSFSYEIVKGGGITIRSTWKWVDHYLKSRTPYKINVYRRRGENKIIPFKDERGNVMFRQAPIIGSAGWEHPAITKYNFIEAGIEKGEKKAIRKVLSLIQSGAL